MGYFAIKLIFKKKKNIKLRKNLFFICYLKKIMFKTIVLINWNYYILSIKNIGYFYKFG